MGNLIDFFRNDLFAADAGIELLEAGEGRALARMTIGPRHFNAAGVVQGGADVAAAFAALPLDHLVFTGSTAVGRKVMAAAAANLTPLTL